MRISFSHVLACSALFASVNTKRRIYGSTKPSVPTSISSGNVCPSTIKERKFRRGLDIVCPTGSVIAHAKVEGVNGNCQGTNPELYVQELLCHWKNSCQLRYNQRPAYLFIQRSADQTNLSHECMAKESNKFRIKFECTKGVQVFDMFKRDEIKEVRAMKGVFRSHTQHPWLYHRADHALTFLNPEHARPMDFLYTFRHFHLWDKDFLTVTWIPDGTDTVWAETYRSNFTLNTERATRIVRTAERVVFDLKTVASNGGAGFVVCFVWSHPGVKPGKEGACRDLFQKGKGGRSLRASRLKRS